jgi:Arc/MetJ family transcription regulator
MDDDALLARAERALTEIKVNQGLSEEHAAVLAAIRIRLTGSEGASLEALLEAAEDPGSRSLEDLDPAPTHGSLDDLLAREPAPKPDWPS